MALCIKCPTSLTSLNLNVKCYNYPNFEAHLRRNDMSDPSDLNCNEMLLEAVRKCNLEEVEPWLQHPDFDINYDIGYGETVLFESIFMRNEPVFLRLLNAGFDIHARNERRETPLHRATVCSSTNFVHELIKRGADINAQDLSNTTPLIQATILGKFDTVCMLLYFGADVKLVCNRSRTALMWALQCNYIEISNLLVNYYDDFPCETYEGEFALYNAIKTKNPIIVDILNLGINKTKSVEILLRPCLLHNSNELFKLILARYDQPVINDSFLLYYLSYCRFPNSEWLECLHLLFRVAKIAFKLLTDNKCFNNVFRVSVSTVLSKLFVCFHTRSIELCDRMALIYLFLSSGFEITTDDVNCAYFLYGFNDELEALMHAFDYKQPIARWKLLPLPRFIFALEHDYQIGQVLPVFRYLDTLQKIADDVIEDVIIKSLGFCSISSSLKEDNIDACRSRFQNVEHIVKQLDAIPEVPSLLELCRNQTRELIKQRSNISKSYQFYEIIKGLNLPVCIKDIICFKTAIY